LTSVHARPTRRQADPAQFNVQVRRICHHCDGSGAHSPKDIVECPHCQGQGIVLVRQQIAPGMFTQMQQHCPHCQGRGRTIKRSCPVCAGQRLIQTTNTLSLSIDRGLPEDSEIVFEGEADEAPDYEPGDVVVRVKSKADEGGFTRKGPHLYYKQAIGVDEALLGFERKVKGLDGHWLALKREGTTQPGFTQIVKEEGMRASLVVARLVVTSAQRTTTYQALATSTSSTAWSCRRPWTKAHTPVRWPRSWLADLTPLQKSRTRSTTPRRTRTASSSIRYTAFYWDSRRSPTSAVHRSCVRVTASFEKRRR
jgi:hypothetical protein